jgi:hypothetical protein
MADPSVDPAPEGTILVGLPDDSPVNIGWIYDPATGQFTDPNPPQEEEEVVIPDAEV